jgi:hypothetical protein
MGGATLPCPFLDDLRAEKIRQGGKFLGTFLSWGTSSWGKPRITHPALSWGVVGSCARGGPCYLAGGSRARPPYPPCAGGYCPCCCRARPPCPEPVPGVLPRSRVRCTGPEGPTLQGQTPLPTVAPAVAPAPGALPYGSRARGSSRRASAGFRGILPRAIVPCRGQGGRVGAAAPGGRGRVRLAPSSGRFPASGFASSTLPSGKAPRMS